MMNRPFLLAVAVAALFSAGFGPQNIAVAQEAPVLQPAAGLRPHLLRLKNVSPSMVAWWIDPTHQREPLEFLRSRINAEGVFPQKLLNMATTSPLKSWTLPEGVQRVVGIDPQNALLVFGTDAGLAELQKTIADLDKPLQQVQVEIRYIAISNEDVMQAGIVADAQTTKQGPWTQGEVSANSLAQIDELVKQDKAKVITSPRVTAINNLAAQIHSFTVSHVTLGYEDKAKYYGVPNALSLNADTANLPNDDGFLNVAVGVSIGFSVVPTINGDETISLLLAPGRLLQLGVPSSDPVQAKEGTPWQRNIDGIQTISNMKDGETVALMGSDTRLFEQFSPAKQNYSKVLILVTARLVRRIG